MKYERVYFFNGTAYAGKSTMVKRLAEAHNGIACEENYHEARIPQLDAAAFPNLTYTSRLADWADFIRRTPDEYERWIDGATDECAILELELLTQLRQTTDKPIFVDTNIPIPLLHEISDPEHVLIMLADPEVSVRRFFDRPDREKQFLYQLLLAEPDPEAAMANFRACLARINSQERFDRFLHSGFPVLLKDERRSIAQTMQLVESILKL